jgi:hypothetical protein
MLRQDVQKIVENADSSEEASFLISYLMQNKLAEMVSALLIALFRNDSEMQALLSNNSPELSERVSHLLSR